MTAVDLPPLKSVPSPNYSSRHGTAVHLVVCHRPVGSYAGSIATLCEDRGELSASAHVITKTGGVEATQLVGWGQKAWACEAFNAFSDNLELSDEMWVGDDPHGLAVAARIVAFRCHVRGVPALWTRAPHTTPGVCRHYDLGIAGGGHTDPTTDDHVWEAFMHLVAAELARGGFRKTWGHE